jgi:hypothetical protein
MVEPIHDQTFGARIGPVGVATQATPELPYVLMAVPGWILLATCLLVSGCSQSQTTPLPSSTPSTQEAGSMNEFAKIAIGFVLGSCIAVFAEPLRRWLFKSRVSLCFQPKIGFGRRCVSLTTTNHSNVMAKYIRVLAKCSSRCGITAKQCRPFLTKIEKLDPAVDGHKELHHDPLPLNWAFIGDQPLDINSRMEFYFDVVEINSAENSMKPQITTIVPTTWTEILRETGKYRFSVPCYQERT